ncbi:unnamed protein product [Leuciscus chuanchicus]
MGADIKTDTPRSQCRRPKAKELVNRTNKIIKRTLPKYCNAEQNDWDERLGTVMYAINTLAQGSTKFTPFFYMFNRHPLLYKTVEAMHANIVIDNRELGTVTKIAEVLPNNAKSSLGEPLPVELLQECAGPSEGVIPAMSFGASPDDQMSITASEGEPDPFGDDDLAMLPPLGTIVLPKSDPEIMAMLSGAAERIGLEWNPSPCPEPSRLDDRFVGVARAGS